MPPGPPEARSPSPPLPKKTPLADAVIVAVPCFANVTRPEFETPATDVLDEVQVSLGGDAMVAPVESWRTAVICVELPGTPVIDVGESWIVASTGLVTVVGTESVRPPTLM